MTDPSTPEPEFYTLPPADHQTLPLMSRKWLVPLAVVFFVGPPVYLAFQPSAYTPLLEVMLNLFLFVLAYFFGYTQETERATRRANDRWLPQAESVILRLITLHANVRHLGAVTKSRCDDAACQLPELEDSSMRAVRVKLRADCEASSDRLLDIANQLVDAIEDWRRFIVANCEGQECERIYAAIQDRQRRLDESLAGLEPASGASDIRA